MIFTNVRRFWAFRNPWSASRILDRDEIIPERTQIPGRRIENRETSRCLNVVMFSIQVKTVVSTIFLMQEQLP